MIEIFDIENDKVVINVNCLMIPELKAVNDFYEDPMPVFCFLHYYTNPRSAYNNLDEEERESSILYDYPGEYTLEDEVIESAIRKLQKLNTTPTMKLLESGKIGLERLSTYIRTQEITSGRDGNMNTYLASLKSISQINKEFKALEKQAEDEVQSQGRGGVNWSYDEL